ncbi:hypothetical protein OUZ56_024076 [Daphnia magna]|uniref:Uncharacterized protein n=1 Tax=Daphnia magna TaxID=35525 RepID=A0ABR0B0R3_9CRUS|nr:hypothetical protein OUZ56_024076 [Daphnia magna]
MGLLLCLPRNSISLEAAIFGVTKLFNKLLKRFVIFLSFKAIGAEVIKQPEFEDVGRQMKQSMNVVRHNQIRIKSL